MVDAVGPESTDIESPSVHVCLYCHSVRLRFFVYLSIAFVCILKLENTLERIDRECLHQQASKSHFGVYVTLNFDLLTPKVESLCPVDHLRQFAAESVYSFSKYRVQTFGNQQTDRWMAR